MRLAWILFALALIAGLIGAAQHSTSIVRDTLHGIVAGDTVR